MIDLYNVTLTPLSPSVVAVHLLAHEVDYDKAYRVLISATFNPPVEIINLCPYRVNILPVNLKG